MNDDRFTEKDFKLAEKCSGPHNKVPEDVGQAAVRVAGEVEAIARDEGVSSSEAQRIFYERYKYLGFYYSLVNRCVRYDEES